MRGRELFAPWGGGRRPWVLATPFIAIGLFVAPQIAAVIALEAFGPAPVGADGALTPAYMLAVLLFGFGVAGAAFIAWTVLVERRSLATIGLARAGFAGAFARGFCLGVGLLMLVIALLLTVGGARVAAPAAAWGDPAALGWIVLFVAGFTVQASVEEVAFRGWMMSAIAARRGIVVAVVANSAMFAVLHVGNVWPVNWLALANVGLLGVFASLLAVKQGGIAGACGVHAGWNWALASGFEVELSGLTMPLEPWVADLDPAGSAALSGAAWGPEGGLVTTVVLGAACAGLAMDMWRGGRASGRRAAEA
ncbi:MAG: CPBP family intramembrane metalloprotease [Caulobacterales bacterium]|nr:CPBP family intramembrane metalloprotease [Caulobacterales bacterium]